MARSCGECVKCCKTMHIIELNKPANVWCPNCNIGVGCKIYSDRPESCRGFECLWLQDDQMPEELRPDRSKVVLSMSIDEKTLVAYVDPAEQNAWKTGSMGRLLMRIAEDMPVLILCGEKRHAIASMTQPFTFTEEGPDGQTKTYMGITTQRKS